SPDAPITRAEAAMALAHLPREQAIRRAIEQGWMAMDHRNWFHPDLPFVWSDLREDRLPLVLPPGGAAPGPVKRSAWARRVSRRRAVVLLRMHLSWSLLTE